MPLEERLDCLAALLEESESRILDNRELRRRADSTGFVLHEPLKLRDYALSLASAVDERPLSLDLGCGNGGWALMAAAAGFPSYGIDINPYLVELAKENRAIAVERGLIHPDTPCEFAVGNIFTGEHYDTYRQDVRRQYSQGLEGIPEIIQRKTSFVQKGDAYAELGVSLEDAGVIYTWPWPSVKEFYLRFLNTAAQPGCLIISPALTCLDVGDEPYPELAIEMVVVEPFIGRKL